VDRKEHDLVNIFWCSCKFDTTMQIHILGRDSGPGSTPFLGIQVLAIREFQAKILQFLERFQ
jgi:hypothetical protein